MTGRDLIYLIAAVSLVISELKWLRVCQREHYLPGYTTRFFFRWWFKRAENRVLFALAIIFFVCGIFFKAFFVGAILILGIGPSGLALIGTTSKINFTRRLTTIAILSLVIDALLLYTFYFAGDFAAPIAILLAPVIIEASLIILIPVEKRLAEKYKRQAREKLEEIKPISVGITGSWGKTSVKNLAYQLSSNLISIAKTPKSFNNELGIARTINENLYPNTKVFLVEMGMYKKGEIRQICSWVRPKIAVITAIGPVHLERLGTIENIVEAKSEILDTAEVAILNIDNEYLKSLAINLKNLRPGLKLQLCSASKNPDADVCVYEEEALEEDRLVKLRIGQDEKDEYFKIPRSIALINVALAVSICLELGLPFDVFKRYLNNLENAEHRLSVINEDANVKIVDDSYNSNPEGAAFAIDFLTSICLPNQAKVVVTPGIIELGDLSYKENFELGKKIKLAGAKLIIVKSTNKKSLKDGYGEGAYFAATRKEALSLAKKMVATGGVVLIENDLPDHYP